MFRPLGLFGLALLLALMGATLLASLSQRAVAQEKAAVAESPFMTGYLLPNDGAPRYLVHADDQLWFTAPGGNAIGRLVFTSTVDYAYTFFPIPTDDSIPYDLTWDGTNVWFTMLAGNKIGRLDVASGDITEYNIPTPNSEPTGITAAGGDTIWFVERSGNKLGAFDPTTETFVEYTYEESDAALEDVAASSSGNHIWFTAPGVNRLVRFDSSTEEFRDIPTSEFGIPPYTPSQIVLDDQGNPWVSTAEGLVGRFAAATFQYFRWYQVGSENSEIDGLIWLAEGNNNKLWFTESNTGYAGQLTVKSGGTTVSEWRFPVTDGGGIPTGVTIDANGSVWIADSGNHMLLQWSPPYVFSANLPAVMKSD